MLFLLSAESLLDFCLSNHSINAMITRQEQLAFSQRDEI
jgi:hypothetical protein